MFQRTTRRIALILGLAFAITGCSLVENASGTADAALPVTSEVAETALPRCRYDPSDAERRKLTFKRHAQAVNAHLIVIHGETNQKNTARPDGELLTYAEQFAAVMKGFAAWRQTDAGASGRMMLIFNGGLNPTVSVKNRATRQTACILRHGFYPVFMVWSSDVFASYGEQSLYIRNGVLHESVQPTFPLYIASDIAASIIRAPQTWINELGRFIDSVTPPTRLPIPSRAMVQSRTAPRPVPT